MGLGCMLLDSTTLLTKMGDHTGGLIRPKDTDAGLGSSWRFPQSSRQGGESRDMNGD